MTSNRCVLRGEFPVVQNQPFPVNFILEISTKATYLDPMNLSEVESAVMSLPVDERKILAARIWESVELPEAEVTALMEECDKREKEADATVDGWVSTEVFMGELKNRAR